jgi:predicted dehydrogenase
MDSSSVVRVVIVGAGKMGREHLRACQAIPECEIVGVVSRGGRSAADLAREFGIPHHGVSWQEVANVANAHACIVAVSHDRSAEVCREIIDAGLHVLAEKPVALTSSEVSGLAELASRRKVTALAAVNRRFFPAITQAVDRLRMMGAVYQVSVYAPDSPETRRIDAKHSQFVCDSWLTMNTIHAIDILRMIGGDIAQVTGYRTLRERKDHQTIVASVLFKNNVLGTFILPGGINSPWELKVVGEDCEVYAKPFEELQIKIGNGVAESIPNISDKKRASFKLGLYEQARAFVDAVRFDCVAWPCSDFVDHAKTLELIESLETLPVYCG